MLSFLCLSETVRVTGVAVFSYRISLPSWDDRRDISAFYQAVAEKTGEFCRSRLVPFAEADFSASDDPKKRFRYAPFFYTLTGEVTGEREGMASVLLTAKWGRRGEGALWGEGFDAHTWDLSEEVLLPPDQVCERVGSPRLKRKEKKACRGVLLFGEALRFCDARGVRAPSVSEKRTGKKKEKSTKNSSA